MITVQKVKTYTCQVQTSVSRTKHSEIKTDRCNSHSRHLLFRSHHCSSKREQYKKEKISTRTQTFLIFYFQFWRNRQLCAAYPSSFPIFSRLLQWSMCKICHLQLRWHRVHVWCSSEPELWTQKYSKLSHQHHSAWTKYIMWKHQSTQYIFEEDNSMKNFKNRMSDK